MQEKTIKLDSYDRKIIFELDKNARITTTTLGKKTRKSKQFVDYRIKRLEETGVLSKYITVIDYSRLGYQSIRIYFKFHNITREKQDELEHDLIKDSGVWWLVTLEGKWDVGLAFAVEHTLDFYEYWDKIINKYRKYINKHSVEFYTHIRQYPKSYIIKQKNSERGTLVGASKEMAQIVKLDKQLLKVLSNNGRMALLEIATKLKTSPQVIRNHIKKLEKNKVILGYRALIDVSFLGYRYYKAFINLLNTERMQELQQFCLQHPNILNVNRTMGGRDFEIELQTKSFDEFDSIMNEIRKQFAGTIDDYEFVIARKEKKMVYFPFK
jgi:Lrp/AsnC family transcriptional regulator, leucine-responsive regulatory protein